MIKKILYFLIFIFIITINILDFKIYSTNENTHFKVEIKGAINKPGVYEVDDKMTINDLIVLASLKDGADISGINQTYSLYPNQVINIPYISDDNQKISINSADIKDLCTLKGIGEKTALKIIDYRNKNNGFKQLDELLNVSGIGLKTYENIKEFISL